MWHQTNRKTQTGTEKRLMAARVGETGEKYRLLVIRHIHLGV